MNLQILLVEKSCLETSHRACCFVTPCICKSQAFREVSTRGGKSSAALCSVSQSRLSLPAASRHAPIAPDCLIGTFQVRGLDRPGQSTQTVIHLFGSRRCSCPLFLRSPRGISGGVIWRRGKEKSMTNDLAFFPTEHSKKRTAIFMWSSYWPTSLSIIQSRLRRENTIK